MARYILIDNASGYIWGDSADLDGKIFNSHHNNPQAASIDFAAALDRHVDASVASGRRYETVSRHALVSNETGYHVYRADVRGSEAVPVVQDGQDRDMIEAVERDCQYVTSIKIT